MEYNEVDYSNILELKERLKLFDCSGSLNLDEDGMFYFYSYFDETEKRSFIVLKRGEEKGNHRIVLNAEYNLNDYDKVKPGLQLEYINLVIRNFAFKTYAKERRDRAILNWENSKKDLDISIANLGKILGMETGSWITKTFHRFWK
jgi:hypothetical protein